MQKQAVRFQGMYADNHARNFKKIANAPSTFIVNYSDFIIYYISFRKHFMQNSIMIQFSNHRTTFYEKSPCYSCTSLYNRPLLLIKKLRLFLPSLKKKIYLCTSWTIVFTVLSGCRREACVCNSWVLCLGSLIKS